MTTETSKPTERFRYRPDLAQAATPRTLKTLPRHRWFYFPHSYGPALVEAILDHWQLPRHARVFDPFVGAGTTLLVARERGLDATGLDISPLAVLASRVKTRDYDVDDLRAGLKSVLGQALLEHSQDTDVASRLRRAFSASELTGLLSLRHAIDTQPEEKREFLLLALLSVARDFSRAVADGGWFRWVERPSQGSRIIPAFKQRVEMMILDVQDSDVSKRRPEISVVLGDSRGGTRGCNSYDAVITSPPYANRHDYTRVFHIELLLMGLSESDIFGLRHQSLRSHVEARGDGLTSLVYEPPSILRHLLAKWPTSGDERIPHMLAGYFEDLYRTLVNIRNVLPAEGTAAFVLGNVRHGGILIPVDEAFAMLAAQAGMKHAATWVIRERGNSAQQMGRFGREPARESIVFVTRE
jgi:hypothetical protein